MNGYSKNFKIFFTQIQPASIRIQKKGDTFGKDILCSIDVVIQKIKQKMCLLSFLWDYE
jgi:hypothetical protein